MKYECIEDYFMDDGKHAFTKGKTYEINRQECMGMYCFVTRNNYSNSPHSLSEKTVNKFFRELNNNITEKEVPIIVSSRRIINLRRSGSNEFA